MDVLGALAPSARAAQVQVGIGQVVLAADNVRDAEVDVVDDAGEVVGGASVLANKGDAVEARLAEALGCGPVGRLSLALPDRALVPLEPNPAEILGGSPPRPARDIARRVRVIDPQEEPVPLAAVGTAARALPT